MCSSDLSHQPRMTEMIEATGLSIALTGCINQRQLTRCAKAGFKLRRQEMGIQRDRNFLGKTDPDEAAGGHGVAIMNQAHGLGGSDDLVASRTLPDMITQIEIGVQDVSSQGLRWCPTFCTTRFGQRRVGRYDIRLMLIKEVKVFQGVAGDFVASRWLDSQTDSNHRFKIKLNLSVSTSRSDLG